MFVMPVQRPQPAAYWDYVTSVAEYAFDQ